MNEKEQSPQTFEMLYLKERKKAKIFMVVAAIVGILFIGAVVIMLSKGSLAPSGGSHNAADQSGGHGGGSSFSNLTVKDFFRADGSVDGAKVDSFLNSVPADHKSQLSGTVGPQIDAAVTKGDISNQQATELKQALGI